MKLTELDIYELRQWFENLLSRTQKVDKRTKMRMRRKIRDEIFLLLTWEQPSPASIMHRWEDRLFDFFAAMPCGVEDELLQILSKKLKKV